MSFLNPSISKNPVSKWGEFKGSQGAFRFWNAETENNDFLQEIIFMPIFIHNGVAGFSEKLGGGIYSNEVENASGVLTVRCNKQQEPIAIGKWAEIKEAVEALGGSYAKVAYGVKIFKDSDGNRAHELIAIKIFGTAIGGWIDAKVNVNEQKALLLTKGEARKKGIVDYFTLSVKKYKKDEGLIQIAMPYAIALDAYFKEYFNKDAQEQVQEQGILSSPQKVAQIEAAQIASPTAEMDAEFAMAGDDFSNAPDPDDELPF